jgi:hypothetical protein
MLDGFNKVLVKGIKTSKVHGKPYEFDPDTVVGMEFNDEGTEVIGYIKTVDPSGERVLDEVTFNFEQLGDETFNETPPVMILSAQDSFAPIVVETLMQALMDSSAPEVRQQAEGMKDIYTKMMLWQMLNHHRIQTGLQIRTAPSLDKLDEDYQTSNRRAKCSKKDFASGWQACMRRMVQGG